MENEGPISTKRILIVPAVAVGNIGQIACDLLARKLGKNGTIVDHDGCLTPCVGRNPSGKGVATPLESYDITESVSCLVIRSMVIPGRSREFVQLVLAFAKQKGYSTVLVVGGASALALVKDEQFAETRYLPRLLTKRKTIPKGFLECEFEVQELKLAGLLPYLVEAGNEQGIEIEAIVSYTFEGDNIPDGERMAAYICAYSGISLSA